MYFNQKPALDPASLVVMDDAHLAEGPLQSLYSLSVTRFDHEQLFRRLTEELSMRLPHYASLAAATGDGGGPEVAEVISFADQGVVSDVLTTVLGSARLPTGLAFRWPRLRDRLERCVLFVTRDALWLRPWVYPLQANDHYRCAEQRLYLSATIGDPADLSRRLGTGRIQMIRIDRSFSEQTVGRRLVVLDPSDDQERVRAALAAALSVTPKSVWLCASRGEVRRSSAVVEGVDRSLGRPPAPRWTVNGTGDEIESFRVARSGHLLAAGRFDGMDFRGEECRVIVVPQLPRATNPQEEFISQQLGGGGVLVGRQNARIVQALGRANRSEGDHAVYLLPGSRFATHLSRESFRRSLPAEL
ncbi:MAG: helicase C-terminal domain-containing protein, partial [Pseudonocardiaceae bacterium]